MQNSSKKSEGFFQKHTISLIMLGLLAIIGFLLFSDFSSTPIIVSEKIDPYVLSTKGDTLIIRDTTIAVGENKQASILIGDRIQTNNSLATIFWPDGSLTRLGEKSSIRINAMQAKTANENIQINFSLESGKTWSNVVKYMFGDSYFHEQFNDDTALAAVRGTVFEINLDRKYIHTIDHAISVEDIGSHTGSTFVVAGGLLDTDTRNILLKNKIDELWNKANNDADVIYLNQRMEALKKQIFESKIGQKNYMNTFLQEIGLQKTKVSLDTLLTDNTAGWTQFANSMKEGNNSQHLMDIYQQFYGLHNTDKIVDTKMKLRDLVLKTAPADKKQTLLTDFARSTLYDSWNMTIIGSGNIEGLQKKLENYLQRGADKNLINSLKDANMQENIKQLDNTLENAKQTLIQTLSEKNLLEEAKKKMTIENVQKINNEADKIHESITNGLQKLIQ
ncbi:hypothetical protein AUK10_01305 [Candidatus Gracilibacteria bacterium CG2_30_37_12]|nr:MAG: hypothetical protein AUK10_01305 [Candidatus Gracilibacteria bacterium CG2_30_37_12]